MHKTVRRWPLTLTTKGCFIEKIVKSLATSYLYDQPPRSTPYLYNYTNTTTTKLKHGSSCPKQCNKDLIFFMRGGETTCFFTFSIITFRLSIEPYWLLGPLGINLYFILRFRERLINQFNYLKWLDSFI